MIGCAYAPNVYQGKFYSKLLAEISEMDPEVDQRSPARSLHSKMREATKGLWSNLQLFDTRRVINPIEKDYTFFSHLHCNFLRIDYFFTSRTVLDRVEVCKIGTWLLSDHADTCIVISPPSPHTASCHWCLNPLLLKHPSFMTFLKDQMELFFSPNVNKVTNLSTLWETFKPYLKGVIISYGTVRKREAWKEQIKLEKQLSDFDKQIKNNSSAHVVRKAEATHTALNQLLSQKAEASILYAKHRLFERGDKPGQLLACLAAGRHETNAISSLWDEAGKNLYETKMLAEIMKKFHKNLYTSKLTTAQHAILWFKKKISAFHHFLRQIGLS